MPTIKTYYRGHKIEVSADDKIENLVTKVPPALLHPNPSTLAGALVGVKCQARLSIDGEPVDEQRATSSVAELTGHIIELRGFPRHGTPMAVTATVEMHIFRYHFSIYADGRLIFQEKRFHW